MIIAIIIAFIALFITYHMFFKDEGSISEPQAKTIENKETSSISHESTLIEILYPLIDILCHYSVIIEKEWTSEKVRFIKNIFEKDCTTEKQLVLLRDRIKLNANAGVKPPVNLSISKYLAFNPDMDSKISLFHILINVLAHQSNDHSLIIKISLDFSEKVDIPYHYAIEILKESGYFIDNERTNNSKNTDNNEPEDIKNILWALKVFDLDENKSDLTKEMIIKHFQQKIKEFHPDKNGSVTDAVREILNQKTSDLYDAREILLNYISKI